MGTNAKRKRLPALKVHQWLVEWDKIAWTSQEKRREPQHWFYQFSMSAPQLKALCGIYARTTADRESASEDLGIQRWHDTTRSQEISRFVKYGYPWSSLSEAKRTSGEFQELQKPGWLPTAIVVNILTPSDERLGKKVARQDLIEVVDGKNGEASLILPDLRDQWSPQGIAPVEVIDGQHRLWAFGEEQLDGNFQMPVVAFVGLDLSWQAYLFYTINIKPKKINASLAFDLYPLLRTEDWLTKFEGHIIYRETRAQELVDLLWAHPDSPWHKRINMLGEPGRKGYKVTQASWVRSLLVSYVKRWEGPRVSIGGLFGSKVGDHETVLPWSRLEQAAFLMVLGQCLQNAIQNSTEPWMGPLREPEFPYIRQEERDPAFFGNNNLLNSDQGVRALLQVSNDLLFLQADKLGLRSWGGRLSFGGSDSSNDSEIAEGISSLKSHDEISRFLADLSDRLATYDWRASSARGLSEEEKMRKAAYRGSSGYRELRRDVLRFIATGEGDIGQVAKDAIERLGY